MLVAALALIVPQPVRQDDLLERAAPACVQIRSYGRTMAAGSGFVFGARNVVVTSARTVAGASRNVVIDRAGNAHRAIGLVKDSANDLAIILLDEEIACTPFEAVAEPGTGAPAVLVGYPLARPEISAANGTIAALVSANAFSLTLPVGAGASGAAVLTPEGELLGLASRTEAGRGIVIPGSLVAAAARSAIASAKAGEAKAGGVRNADETYREGRDRGEIVDDPTDANGEFAPAREAIEMARRRENGTLPEPPAVPRPVEVAPEPKAPRVAATVDPRSAPTAALARFWGGLYERKARWYVAPDGEAAKRRAELLEFVRDPAHRSAIAETGVVDPGEWDRTLIVLESEVEEIALERDDADRLVEADERLVARLRRRLWTDATMARIDPEAYRLALTPVAAAAPLLERFEAIVDPNASGAVVAVTANPELRAGDEITAIVVDGGTPVAVRSLRELASASRGRSGSIALLVRRSGRTRLVGEPAH